MMLLQLNRYFVLNGTVTKNSAPLFVSSSIEVVTEIEDELFCRRKFIFSAIINHSGDLNSGHYTCLVKDGDTWWHCNDKAAVQVNLDDMNKLLPCFLFFIRPNNFFYVIFVFICRGGLTDHSFIFENERSHI